jgi:hypothetical protein
MKIHIIGCGGVAGYFLSGFLRTLYYAKSSRLRSSVVVLHDGDKLEEKNLQRQNFERDGVGLFKSDLLRQDNRWFPHLESSPAYIDTRFRVERPGDLVIVFADNHLARLHALSAADDAGCALISAANSTIGAEAWFYEPAWRESVLDPRVRWPEILTDDTGSPVHAAGCQSEERLREVPQTPIANNMAAALAMLMFNFHLIDRPGLDAAMTQPFWPVRFYSTNNSFGVEQIRQLTENAN